MSSTARDQTGWILTTRELRGTAASLATAVVATAADGPFGDVDYGYTVAVDGVEFATATDDFTWDFGPK
jgi:hypothetical protein